MSNTETDTPQDRLFVPLKTEHYLAFESGEKDVELRGYGNQFNDDTVYPGRRVELRRGYSTDDSLWGTIEEVHRIWTIEAIPTWFRKRIRPDATRDEFLESVDDLLGDYNRFIAFGVSIDDE